MFERLLAFASVTAVACFGFAFTIGGCSSSDPAGPTPVPDAGGAPDAPTTPPTGDDDPREDVCGPKGAYATMEAYDAEVGWKPPAPRQNVCTGNDLQAIKAAAAKQLNTLHDLVAGTNADCQACVLTTKDSPNWGPLVLTNEQGTEGYANFGACHAAVDSPACGKARQYLELCVHNTCSECTDAADRASCAEKAPLKQCESMFVEAQTQCTKVAESDQQCSSIVSAIEYLCAYEGADAGAPDGG